MKKFFKFFIIATMAAMLCITLALASCSSSTAVGIESISLTSIDGNVDTYTIYYTDGSTSTYTVTNGVNGEDGEDGKDGKDGADGTDSSITVEDLYETYKSYYGDDLTYAEFLSMYLTTASNESSSINSCLLSAAKVYTEFDYTYQYYDYSYMRPSTKSTDIILSYTGSAILYSMNETYSYFVTNYHVVYDSSYTNTLADRIHIYLYGSESNPEIVESVTISGTSYATEYTYDEYAIEGEYIGGSATSDIAVIKVKTEDVLAINPNFTAVTLADGYHVGETAYTIGNAEGEGLSLTKGIVSVDSEYITLSEVDGVSRYYRSIRIDTAVYEGNSGGGLFNADGELIGLVNAGSSSDQNINYAIPLSIVTGTVDNIIYYYEDENDSTVNSYTVILGINYTTENSKYVYDSVKGYGEITEDTVISGITSGSIAETIGLNEGDYLEELIITDNSGNTTTYNLTRSFTVTDLLLTIRPGYEISFTYTRDGNTETTSTYTVTLEDLTARD